MEIKNAETKLDQADSFLTKLKDVLKKHWGILMLIGVGYFFYWAFTTDFEEEPIEEPKVETVQPVKKKKKDKKYKVIDRSYIIDKKGYRKGDTIYLDYYDDGFVDKYYQDGETFTK